MQGCRLEGQYRPGGDGQPGQPSDSSGRDRRPEPRLPRPHDERRPEVPQNANRAGGDGASRQSEGENVHRNRGDEAHRNNGDDLQAKMESFMQQILLNQQQFMQTVTDQLSRMRSRSASPERRTVPGPGSNVPNGAGVPGQGSAQHFYIGEDEYGELGTTGRPPTTTTPASVPQTPVFASAQPPAMNAATESDRFARGFRNPAEQSGNYGQQEVSGGRPRVENSPTVLHFGPNSNFGNLGTTTNYGPTDPGLSHSGFVGESCGPRPPHDYGNVGASGNGPPGQYFAGFGETHDEVLTEMVMETAFRTTDSADHLVITTGPAQDKEEARRRQHLPVRLVRATARLSSRKGRRRVTDSARPN